MEEMGIPTIEQGETKKEQKSPFEVLTTELAGKTRDELTPEQREIEDAYREKCFRDLLQLVNDDEVLSHGTNNLESVLQRGILSNRRLRVLGLGSGRDPRAQENAQEFLKAMVGGFSNIIKIGNRG